MRKTCGQCLADIIGSESIDAAAAVENLTTTETDTSLVLAPDGAGGTQWVSPAGGVFSYTTALATTSLYGVYNVATLPGLNSIQIGWAAYAKSNGCVAIGKDTYTYQSGAVAIGQNAKTYHTNGIAIGSNSNAKGIGNTNGIAIGQNSVAYSNGVGIGQGANAYTSAVAAGTGSYAYNNATALGFQASATTYGVAVGRSTTCGNYAVSVGPQADANGTNSTVVGTFAASGPVPTGGISIGYAAYTYGINALAVGFNSSANANAATALGANIINNTADSIRMGWANTAGNYIQMADFTPTAETPTATHTISVTLNGSTYRILMTNA